MRENACPNCGASMTEDKRVSLCQYCGTKIARNKQTKSGRRNDLYEKAITELKFKQYEKCRMTLFLALRYDPYNSDLILMDAVLRKDATKLDDIEVAELSQMVVELCGRELTILDVDMTYSIDKRALAKANFFTAGMLRVTKYTYDQWASSKQYLALAKILYSDEEYANAIEALERKNEAEYRKARKELKSLVRRYYFLSIASLLFFIPAMIILVLSIMYSAWGYLVLVALIGGIAVFIYSIAKSIKTIERS